jgi:hypothetical protein
MENWKDVIGYEGQFMISESGKVKSLNRTCIRDNGTKYSIKGKDLTNFISNVGYVRVALRNKGKQIKYSVHRLVADAFVSKEIGRDFVNHIDGNRLNNHYSNLEWVSMMENNCHRINKSKTSSQFTGVSFINAKQKYVASICINKKSITIGHFDLEHDAYIARCNYELKNGIINKYL